MEPPTEEGQGQKETNPAFKTGGSHIQIDSIAIDLSSSEINESPEGCIHFTIRGFVAEVRKKNIRICSPFISDRSDNSSDMIAYELPPMEVRKFRSSDCSSCVEDSNSSQGTSKDSMGKSTPPQNTENQRPRRLKGFTKLYIKAGLTDLIDGSWTSERSAKENQPLDGRSSAEMSEEIIRDPLSSRGNNQSILQKKSAKGKRLPHDAFSQGGSKENEMVGFSNSRGPSSGKSVNEAVMVPFDGLNCAKDTSSRKSDKDIHLRDDSYSQGTLRGVMAPRGGSAGKAAAPKSSKEPKQRKAAPTQGMSKEFAMPPPGGFYSRKISSKALGKGYPRQHHGPSPGASSDIRGNASEKTTSSLKPSKQQNMPSPRPNIRIKNNGEVSNSTSLNEKRSYAKRSVRQAESAGDKHDKHKGREDGFESNSNQDCLPHDAGAMEADVVAPKRAALQLKGNEEVGSCNGRLEKNSNISAAGKTQDRAGQSLPECYQSVKDNGKNHVNVDEEDHMAVKLRREPKFRLLSDVIAKKPANVGKQVDNSKALTVDPHDVLAGKVTSERPSEQSLKRKVSPVGSYDTSAGKGVSAKGGEISTKTKPSPVVSRDISAGRGVSVPGIRRKRKRSTQDGEERSPGGEEQIQDASGGGSKRVSFRIAEPGPSVSPVAMNCTLADAKKQSKQILDKADAEKRSKKAKFQQRPESQDNCEKMDLFLQTAFGTGKAEKVHGNGKKKNISFQDEEGQTASKFLQGGVGDVQNVPGDDTSDCIFIGNGPNKRNHVMESSRIPTTALPAEVEHYQNSISTEKESWKPQEEARGTMEERKAGEGPSCTEKGKNVEAKGRVKDIDINSIPVDDKTPDQGSTDDIPMEIVELLAKHQHERRCEAGGDTLSLVGPTGDSNTQRHTSMLKPQASYAANGFSERLQVMNPGKQKVSDNFEAGRTNVLVGYPKDGGHFSGNFTGYTQSKGHVPSGAQYSSSVGPTFYRPSSPIMIQQPQPSFGRYQGGPSSPLNTQIWSPTMQSRASLGMHTRGPGMLHKGSVPYKFDRVSTANQSSVPPQTWNSRISEYANQSPTPPPQTWKWNSKISEYANGVRQNAADFISPKGIRPVDLSSNETIPALQLLNLVQVASRSSTPPVNRRNSELLKRLPFDPSDNRYKKYAPGPHFEPYNKATASTSRHPDSEGRNPFVDESCQCPPGLPAAPTFAAAAFQNEPNVGKSGGIKNRWTFSSLDQQNMAASSYNAPVGNLCFDKSTTRVYSNDKKRHFSSGADKVIIAQGPSSSSINIAQPMKKQVLDFASHHNERALVPFHNKAEVCSTNRNPAEILDLREVRSFMIGPEDLRRGKGKAVEPIRFGPAPRRRKTVLKGNGRERPPNPDNRLLMVGPVIKS